MIKDLNIIIPLRDENEQAEITVHLLNEELKNSKKKFVITLIDDHSSDTTWDLLNKLKEKNFIVPEPIFLCTEKSILGRDFYFWGHLFPDSEVRDPAHWIRAEIPCTAAVGPYF